MPMPSGRILSGVFIVAAAGCFAYAGYILLAWPDPPRDTRVSGFMAEVTANRAAAVTLTFAGMLCGLVAWLLYIGSPNKKRTPRPKRSPGGDRG